MPPRPAAIRRFIFHPRRLWVNGIAAPSFEYHHAFAFGTGDADRKGGGPRYLVEQVL
jgi:hypothetical protein